MRKKADLFMDAFLHGSSPVINNCTPTPPSVVGEEGHHEGRGGYKDVHVPSSFRADVPAHGVMRPRSVHLDLGPGGDLEPFPKVQIRLGQEESVTLFAPADNLGVARREIEADSRPQPAVSGERVFCFISFFTRVGALSLSPISAPHEIPAPLPVDLGLGPHPDYPRASVLLSVDFRYLGALGTAGYRRQLTP